MTHEERIADPARLEAVSASGLLDSPPEADFDRLSRLAAQLLQTPAAFVTVIGGDRQYLKSAVAEGEATDQAGSSTELDRSFCQYAVATGEPFIVEDAREHELVKANKAVADGVIAYAGIPLKTAEGQSIGALCVVDSKPRKWSADDIENLRALARGAMRLIDERKPGGLHDQAGEYLPQTRSLLDCVAGHLQATAAYSDLVEAGADLDLAAEAEARERLIRSQADLRQCYGRHASETSKTQPELEAAVKRYLDADRSREEVARAFSEGGAELNRLEGAIQQHMDAADALRIVAIDHGAHV